MPTKMFFVLASVSCHLQQFFRVLVIYARNPNWLSAAIPDLRMDQHKTCRLAYSYSAKLVCDTALF